MIHESEIRRLRAIYKNQNKDYENYIKENIIKLKLLEHIIGE